MHVEGPICERQMKTDLLPFNFDTLIRSMDYMSIQFSVAEAGAPATPRLACFRNEHSIQFI